MIKHNPLIVAVAAALLSAASAQAQFRSPPPNPSGNRLNNPFRTQFKPAWNLTLDDPVKLVEMGPVTDAKRSNLVLLVAGRTAADTQRKLRIMHWNGSRFDTDAESVSQSIGIDTLLVGRFHPGTPAPVLVPTKTAGPSPKSTKPKPSASSRNMQVLTNTGVYIWTGDALQPLFARQLPDVKQAIVLDNRMDLVVVGAGDGASPFEFTDTEMRPAAREKLQGGGYAHFGIGLQPFPGSDAVNLASGVRFAQAVWTGRTKWLIGLVRGKQTGTPDDPAATTGDRLVVYTPKFPSRDKTFWETRMDDLEEAWRSDPLPGRVLDVRVGDPHNDGKTGILVLTSENDDRSRRLIFFAVSGTG
jgi:hypothetical protein